MAIAIIVEDGTGRANSNSYASIADAKAFCSIRGIVLPTNSDTVAAWLINAADYIESFRTRFKGSHKLLATQAMQWPRAGRTVIDGFPLALGSMPFYLKQAQCQLVADQSQGVALFTSNDPDQTEKLVKIGPLEIEYDNTSNQSYLPAFQAMMEPLLVDGGMFLTTQRI